MPDRDLYKELKKAFVDNSLLITPRRQHFKGKRDGCAVIVYRPAFTWLLCAQTNPPPPPPAPGYVSRIFPPLNLNKSLNIHKETVSYRTLIVPIKVVNFQVIVPRKYHLNEY